IQRRVTTCGGRRKTQPTVRDGLTTTKGMQLWVFPFDLDSDHLLDAESAGIPLRQERRLVAERSELMVV
ncbi:hypothetical protein, partial [Pseudomonas aeruginosa]|uniref:hypothetical protein n=1 Tax=Pseudomonas aeruginosa TaxID=287 RepID=UPI0034E35EB0